MSLRSWLLKEAEEQKLPSGFLQNKVDSVDSPFEKMEFNAVSSEQGISMKRIKGRICTIEMIFHDTLLRVYWKKKKPLEQGDKIFRRLFPICDEMAESKFGRVEEITTASMPPEIDESNPSQIRGSGRAVCSAFRATAK